MGKTYSCPFEGCDMVFSREYQLKKHKITHENPNSLFYCEKCDFYTLDSRNLGVHVGVHTGEKNHQCPDTIRVLGPSGSLVEEPCKYRTNDRSLLTKHRTKIHGYVPHPRVSPQRGAKFTFIPYTVPSASVATSEATSRVSKSKRAQKRNATSPRSNSSWARVADKVQDSTSFSPSTSQPGVDEHEQRTHAESSAAASSSPVGPSNAMSLVPDEDTLLDVHGQRASVESPDATGVLATSPGDTIPVAPNDGIPLDTRGQLADVEPPCVAGSSTTIPVVLNQGILIDALFNDPAPDYDQLMLYESLTAPFVTPADLQRHFFAAGSFMMDTEPRIQGWDESDWNNFYAQYNSL